MVQQKRVRKRLADGGHLPVPTGFAGKDVREVDQKIVSHHQKVLPALVRNWERFLKLAWGLGYRLLHVGGVGRG